METSKSVDIDTELDFIIAEAIMDTLSQKLGGADILVSIRNASMDDFEFFYKLKCEDTNIFWTGHDKKPDRECLLSLF